MGDRQPTSLTVIPSRQKNIIYYILQQPLTRLLSCHPIPFLIARVRPICLPEVKKRCRVIFQIPSRSLPSFELVSLGSLCLSVNVILYVAERVPLPLPLRAGWLAGWLAAGALRCNFNKTLEPWDPTFQPIHFVPSFASIHPPCHRSLQPTTLPDYPTVGSSRVTNSKVETN